MEEVTGFFTRTAPKNVTSFLFAIGVTATSYYTLKTLYIAYQSTKWIPRHIINKNRLNEAAMKQRYGDCWAVITGFNMGIGWEYTKLLAKMKFKLVLISKDDDAQNQVNELKYISDV